MKLKLSDLIPLALVLAALWLAFGGQLPWPVTNPPPFKTDKLAVLVIEETEERGKLTSGQLDVLMGTADGTVRNWVTKNGGDFRLVDVSTPPTLDSQWVQDAFKVEHKSLPWMVAANLSTGASEAVTTTADALKALQPLGGK
jgi:hypothetical protein